MKTPIDFGKDFLYRLFDQRDADACQKMLAGDLVWITPESMHHFLSEGAVLKFVRKQIKAEAESRYVDLISIKSSPSADNIMTVAYEINLVSREEERPLYLRCSMVICRRNRQLEITFLHFSKKSERDSSEQLRDFIANLPCGVMILACLDGHREEAIFYNEYFAHRLRYKQEEFARAMVQNPFFMASEEDRERIQEEIAGARKNGGSITANLRFYRRDGNSFYYRMKGMPAYQADGGTVYYCVFQEITGFQMTTDRLQERLDRATEIVRQIPEAICGIEYPPNAGPEERNPVSTAAVGSDPASAEDKTGNMAADAAGPAIDGAAAGSGTGTVSAEEGDGDVKIYRGHRKNSRTAEKAEAAKTSSVKISGTRPKVIFTSKNIPSMFGVSNSVFMKNILTDPFYGLEITSITRDRLLSSFIFNPDKTATGKAVSCGIFRVQRHDRTEEKAIRVELMVRRVKEKDGTMRLYLFYYDREAMQQDLENRVERAMKMGRAGQEQLRADLRKAKENAARRQNELTETIREAEKKHAAEITRIENSLSEEKKRGVLMSRQLEESRTAQRQIAEERERVEEDASRRIRNHEARAQRLIKEACGARDLLEEQLREAQERSRALEQQLQKEKSRRLLLEEKVRQLQEQKEDLRKDRKDSLFSAPVTISESVGAGILSPSGRQTSASASAPSPAVKVSSGAMQSTGRLQPVSSDKGAYSAFTEAREGDWMTQNESLTVFSSIDPDRTAEPQKEASGKDVLRREEFAPESFIRSIMVAEDTVCSDKEITLRLYLDSRFPSVVIGYASLLRQALCEIVENAISRARKGGFINVHCRADRPSGGFVNLYFRIDDNGSAIPETGMQTMFETEHTAEIGATARPGLYAAQEAAALMGGSLDARSSAGSTRFSLTVAVRV